MAASTIKTPSLPPGFKLDTPGNDELPELPSGFELDKVPKENAGKGVLRAAAQIPLGIAEGTNIGFGGSLLNLIGTGESLAELEELKERLPELKKKFPQLPWPDEINEEKYREALQTATQYNPLTVGGLGQIAEDITGIPSGHPKTRGQELIRTGVAAGKFAPGKLLEKTIRGASVPAVSKLLTSQGVPEQAADTIAFLLAQARGRKGVKVPKATEEISPIKAKGLPSKITEIEKYPSGLTKMKVAEEKVPKLALISKERQKSVINRLNEEARKITKAAIEKHLPIAKQIESGFDFEKAFQEGFPKLEKAANKYNPHINTSPLQNYLKTHQEKFKGLIDLNAEDRAILRSIQNYRIKRPTELASLLKNYRKNNQSIKKLIENAHVTGTQKDLVDYLINVNKQIANSIRETLPADSAWMKSFDNLNKVYGGYQKTKKVQELLGPLLKGQPTLAKTKALIENPKTVKKLELAMGKEGTKEIQQIAKDLIAAKEALKKIPVKDLKAMDAIYPIKAILGFNIPIISGLKKAVDITRTGWGHYLTTPALRRDFDGALKAISKGSIKDYEKATEGLKSDLKLIEHKPKS